MVRDKRAEQPIRAGQHKASKDANAELFASSTFVASPFRTPHTYTNTRRRRFHSDFSDPGRPV